MFGPRFCAKPYKRGKRDEEEVQERSLEARAKPAGYIDVLMGEFRSASAAQPGLYADGYGTCVGIVVTGTPKTPNSPNRIVAHLAMGSWDVMRPAYAAFMNAVISARMTRMKAYLYTIDTTLVKDPELRNDADMLDESAGVAIVYQAVRSRLMALTNNVVIVTHSWAHPGEISVSPAGEATFAEL
jgi:hypothetical protein